MGPRPRARAGAGPASPRRATAPLKMRRSSPLPCVAEVMAENAALRRERSALRAEVAILRARLGEAS